MSGVAGPGYPRTVWGAWVLACTVGEVLGLAAAAAVFVGWAVLLGAGAGILSGLVVGAVTGWMLLQLAPQDDARDARPPRPPAP